MSCAISVPDIGSGQRRQERCVDLKDGVLGCGGKDDAVYTSPPLDSLQTPHASLRRPASTTSELVPCAAASPQEAALVHERV
eukprot:3524927-Rhodomonas_salina.3